MVCRLCLSVIVKEKKKTWIRDLRCFGIPGLKRNMNKSIVCGQQSHLVASGQGASTALPHTQSSSSSPLCALRLLREGRRETRSMWKLPQQETEERWHAHGHPSTPRWARKAPNFTVHTCLPDMLRFRGHPQILGSRISAVPHWLFHQGSFRHLQAHICPRENPKISFACMEEGNCSSLEGMWRKKGSKMA